jgi:hypothetical protein
VNNSAGRIPPHLESIARECEFNERGLAASNVPIYRHFMHEISRDCELLELVAAAARLGQPSATLMLTAANYLILGQPDSPIGKVYPQPDVRPVELRLRIVWAPGEPAIGGNGKVSRRTGIETVTFAHTFH